MQDVSFTINEGERVAIIGRNGAGKSTLLKILARVTEPTRGTAMVRGRMGSLLEVGTGFHPELSGRDNVFLNGSILGMREAEVRAKFDEIVAFSEVEKFIDTPVKHYSSGMRVRLAFSVAAHLEPEVLIVDEVLSVGDVSFRKKCMDQLHKVTGRGATVLVVSHNAQTIVSLCDRAIWLEQGRVVEDGDVSETVTKYLGQGMGLSVDRSWPAETAPGGDFARVRAMRVVTESGKTTDCIDVREAFCVECEVEVLQPGSRLHRQVRRLQRRRHPGILLSGRQQPHVAQPPLAGRQDHSPHVGAGQLPAGRHVFHRPHPVGVGAAAGAAMP